MRYTDFIAKTGAELTDAQRVLSSVAFDGAEPAELDPADREIARKLFGDVGEVPAGVRAVFVAVCGARAGKSRFLCGSRLVHLMATVSLDALAPGEPAYAIIVAPDMRLGRVPLAFALAAAKSHPKLRRRIVDESADRFTISRGRGRSVTLECLPATRGGSAVRGRSLVGAALDEAAFFRDKDYVVCDVDIYTAIAPRIMPGGQLIIASTPWLESGLLFDFFKRDFGRPQTSLVAHAPTLLLNPSKRAEVERERIRDVENCEREFDAQFISGGAAEFFDGPSLRHATTVATFHDRLWVSHERSIRYFAGADFGFRSDHSALAIVARYENTIELVHWQAIKPRKGQPLVPSEVCKAFAQSMHRFGVRRLWSDLHYSESIRQHLRDARIALCTPPGGQPGKAETHTAVRDMLREGRIAIPSRATDLIRELRAVTAKPTSGGGLRISSPRTRNGGHGDLASAFVLAGWAAQPGRTGGVGPITGYL